jgi:hypothetical protein
LAHKQKRVFVRFSSHKSYRSQLFTSFCCCCCCCCCQLEIGLVVEYILSNCPSETREN